MGDLHIRGDSETGLSEIPAKEWQDRGEHSEKNQHHMNLIAK